MWNKFKEGLREGLQSVTLASLVDLVIAVLVVYIIAWLLDEPADNVVGWFALGAAMARVNR